MIGNNFKLVGVVPGDICEDAPNERWATLTVDVHDMPGKLSARHMMQVRVPLAATGPDILAVALDMAVFYVRGYGDFLDQNERAHPHTGEAPRP